MRDTEELESLLTFLLAEPDCRQLCQQLALVSFADVDVWAVAVFIQNLGGQYILSGQFGFDSVAQERLLDLPIAITDTFRSHLAQDHYISNIQNDDSLGFIGLPDFAVDFGPLVIAPLRIPSQTFGCVVIFTLGVAQIENTMNRLRTLRDAVAIHALKDFESLKSADLYANTPSGLTERQMDILHRISLGETNASIARRIGFSESTVRHETIRIFRLLGVHDRKSALLEAEQRGLLKKNQNESDRSIV